MERLFERLSPWAPNLYVHEKDVICQGFIDYFHRRQELQEGVAGSATKLSYRDMLFSLVGTEKEQPHLLPSATLWKNSSVHDVHGAHELQQWWQPGRELALTNSRYSFPLSGHVACFLICCVR
jgi:hypothetical protein